MSVDNNGTLITLPSAPAGGVSSLNGTITFGIGTQSNNSLGSASVYTTSGSGSANGPGLLTVTYNGQTLDQSFIDSGSAAYFFVDAAIPACSDPNYTAYYCPSSLQQLPITVVGANGKSTALNIPLDNAQPMLSSTFSVLPNIGANPNVLAGAQTYPNSFDLGLPFFYGRTIYTCLLYTSDAADE